MRKPSEDDKEVGKGFAGGIIRETAKSKKKKVNKTFSLDEEYLPRFEEICKQKGVYPSEVLDTFIRKFIDSYDSE